MRRNILSTAFCCTDGLFLSVGRVAATDSVGSTVSFKTAAVGGSTCFATVPRLGVGACVSSPSARRFLGTLSSLHFAYVDATIFVSVCPDHVMTLSQSVHPSSSVYHAMTRWSNRRRKEYVVILLNLPFGSSTTFSLAALRTLFTVSQTGNVCGLLRKSGRKERERHVALVR